MAQTAGDILVQTLIDWGVDTIFGLPGDGINGFMEALRTRQDQIRFIQVRHEEGAAFAACGYAKFTGRLGVCIATSGPGRDPPPQRPLRRQARRPAGARDHRADVPRPHRACTTSRKSTSQLFTDVASINQQVMGPAHASTWSSGLPNRAGLRGVAHINSRTTGRRCRTQGEPRPSATSRATRPNLGAAAAASGPDESLQRAADVAQRRQEDRHPRRPGGARRRRRARAVAERWARRSSRRCSARRSSPTTAPTPPAASACSAPCPRSRRWRSATPC